MTGLVNFQANSVINMRSGSRLQFNLGSTSNASITDNGGVLTLIAGADGNADAITGGVTSSMVGTTTVPTIQGFVNQQPSNATSSLTNLIMAPINVLPNVSNTNRSLALKADRNVSNTAGINGIVTFNDVTLQDQSNVDLQVANGANLRINTLHVFGNSTLNQGNSGNTATAVVNFVDNGGGQTLNVTGGAAQNTVNVIGSVNFAPSSSIVITNNAATGGFNFLPGSSSNANITVSNAANVTIRSGQDGTPDLIGGSFNLVKGGASSSPRPSGPPSARHP